MEFGLRRGLERENYLLGQRMTGQLVINVPYSSSVSHHFFPLAGNFIFLFPTLFSFPFFGTIKLSVLFAFRPQSRFLMQLYLVRSLPLHHHQPGSLLSEKIHFMSLSAAPQLSKGRKKKRKKKKEKERKKGKRKERKEKLSLEIKLQ